MEIKVRSEENTSVNQIHDGYIVNNHDLDRLIGKVLTQVETLGLPERQEQSFKDVLKQTIRAGIDAHTTSFTDGRLMNIIHDFHRKLHEECIKNPPPNDIVGESPRSGTYELTFVSLQ